MANPEHLELLLKSKHDWNNWRSQNFGVRCHARSPEITPRQQV